MDTTVADATVGAVLDGRYRIVGRIARGGMSTVYRAVDERLDRRVAVKVMDPGLADSAAFLDRFIREARAVARLSSPYVVNVFDQGTHRGLAFLVMELVEGRTLRDVLSERGRLTAAQAVSVMVPVLSALACAHRCGLVHRDVKPENVLMGDDGTVKVTDFGLARVAQATSSTSTQGMLIGTAAYLAPEVVSTGTADERTDVYSAGVLLYEMLTGEVPFGGESAMAVAYRHVHEDVPPPSASAAVPAALDALVLRATRRDPGARPVDAGAFLAELRDVRLDLDLPAESVPIATGRSSTPRRTAVVPIDQPWVEPVRPPRPARRRRRGLIGTTVVALLLLASIVLGWWLGDGRYARAPSLATLTKAQAVAKAHRLGFRIAFAGSTYSEVVPVDSVVLQRPRALAQIPRGGTITLTLSKGRERYPVPDVAGASTSAAVAALRQRKLVPSLTSAYSDRVPTDRVIKVAPAIGTSVRPGTLVTVVVSKGPPPVRVPDVVGSPQDDARAALADVGLRADIRRAESDTVPVGQVISQEPRSGRLPRGGTVRLVVSKGPPKVAVPDVRGKTADQATAVLSDAGFRVRRIQAPLGPGKVFQQVPGPGHQIPKGSTVTIWVF